MNSRYLFNDSNGEEDLRTMIAGRFEAQKDEINEKTAVFLSHHEEAENRTLMQGLEEIGAVETTSSGGYPAVKVGEGPTNLARNTISSINAVLSIASQKYQVLDADYHLAWHDPRVDAPGVLTVKVNGEWQVFDYFDGEYRPSYSIKPAKDDVPFSKWTRGNERYSNQRKKHIEINRLLKAGEFGTSFLIVLNREEELALYNDRVKDRLEMSLVEVWEAIVGDYQTAQARSHFRRGNGNGGTRVVPEGRQDIVDQLSRVKTPYTVLYDTPASKDNVVLFDPDDPSKDAVLKRILNAPEIVTFTEVKKAA